MTAHWINTLVRVIMAINMGCLHFNSTTEGTISQRGATDKSLRLLADNASEDDSSREKLFAGIDAATSRITFEAKAKTPTELIAIRAQEYFQKFMDGRLGFGEDGKIQFDERRREGEET
jgi:hypothetical protein